jgi:uncharacterized phage protein (TIGR02218 family)
MPRNIPIALRSHLAQDDTTTTVLLRIASVRPGVAPYGAVMTNRELVYDDGDGAIVYSPIIGMQLSTMAAGMDMSVDNAEAGGLLPEFDFPISEADIRAGVYDYARWVAYLVNYEDLSQGHVVLGAGEIGRVSINDDGLSFVEELFGKTKRLRQSVVERDSLTCRAIFGSQPIGTGGGVPEQRFPCGFDATSLLVAGTITSVGLETNITFTSAGVAAAFGADDLAPGKVYWKTGLNAGRDTEIESNTAGGEVTLSFKTDYPMQAGDTFDIRPDCNKQWDDADHGCLRWWGLQRVNHFRGEPHIPIGDAGQLSVPGASVGPSLGGNTSQDFTEGDAA